MPSDVSRGRLRPVRNLRDAAYPGTMLDGLRGSRLLPVTCGGNCVIIRSTIHQLEQAHGRAPIEKELADSLGMSLADYQKTYSKPAGTQLVSNFANEGRNFAGRGRQYAPVLSARPASHGSNRIPATG